jgi:hypothetical protein
MDHIVYKQKITNEEESFYISIGEYFFCAVNDHKEWKYKQLDSMVAYDTGEFLVGLSPALSLKQIITLIEKESVPVPNNLLEFKRTNVVSLGSRRNKSTIDKAQTNINLALGKTQKVVNIFKNKDGDFPDDAA